MPASLNLTEAQVLTALRSFLLSILPSGVEVIRAEANRVPEPQGSDFVLMTPIARPRLSTNYDTFLDTVFTGSIAGTVLTVGSASAGAVATGQTVTGPGVASGTLILNGGSSVFTVAPSQTVALATLYSGAQNTMQPTRVDVQCDVHGPASADNVQIIATLVRDDFACQQFAASGLDVQPLYASEPRQMPFLNGENQYEYRWTVDVSLQANPVVTTPQQFAAALNVGLIEVDAVYPPGA